MTEDDKKQDDEVCGTNKKYLWMFSFSFIRAAYGTAAIFFIIGTILTAVYKTPFNYLVFFGSALLAAAYIIEYYNLAANESDEAFPRSHRIEIVFRVLFLIGFAMFLSGLFIFSPQTPGDIEDVDCTNIAGFKSSNLYLCIYGENMYLLQASNWTSAEKLVYDGYVEPLPDPETIK